MPGTRAGGRKAAQKNLERDPNFYARIGSIGGKNGNTGGFAFPLLCDCDYMEDLHKKAICAGAKGGTVSRRKPNMETQNARN